jgi:hypothetical protein
LNDDRGFRRDDCGFLNDDRGFRRDHCRFLITTDAFVETIAAS